jgi:DNA modification methylase
MSIEPVEICRPLGDKPATATLLYGASCLESLRELPEGSVHCMVTSPPYWGLRDYGGESQVWGGDPACEHGWGEMGPPHHPNQVEQTKWKTAEATGKGQTAGSGQFCQKCDAWLGQFGLEPTPQMYTEHLVEIFREIRRVLRDDGTCWLNLGDSYAGAGPLGASYQSETTKRQAGQQHDGNFSLSKRLGERGLTYNEKKPVPPPGLKSKDLVGVPWRAAFALQDDGWYLRSEIIWCLSGGTRVYARTKRTESPMMIHELVRLNPADVQLWNGERWTQVLGWSETPRPDETFEIELRNGERIGCTGGHEWPTQRGIVRADEIQEGDVIETCRLPAPPELQTPDLLPDEEIGWFVGTYLADGSKGDHDTILQIASHMDEDRRFSRLSDLARSYGGTCARHQTSENGCMINLHGPVLHGIVEQYLRGRTAKDKHLDPRCWRRSDAFLEALMRGYLAGDGHHDDPNSRWRLGFCQNDRLADDLRTVCARIGWSCRLRRCQHQMGDRKFAGWGGDVKVARGTHWNAKEDGEVVAIRRSRARKFWDIGVADEPHLFALASGVLTHNSKPNPLPESVRDRVTRAHEHIFMLTKKARYFYDHDAIKEPMTMKPQRRLTARSGDRHDAMRHDKKYDYDVSDEPHQQGPANGRNKRSVWTVTPRPYRGAHFAVFPPELIEPCILAGTSEKGCCPMCGNPWERVVETEGGGIAYEGSGENVQGDRKGLDPKNYDRLKIKGASRVTPMSRYRVEWKPTCGCPEHEPIPCKVLDPFSGSGTTGVVCLDKGRDYVGLDLNREYLELATARLLGEDAPSRSREDEDVGILEILGVKEG